MTDIIHKDLHFGLSAEILLKPQLETFFGVKLIQPTDPFCPYDFYDEFDNKYEIKSRRSAYATYPTTIIGVDKLRDKLTLIFNFTDGLYFIKYDKELFDTFFKRMVAYNRGKYGSVSEKLHIEIPIDRLTRIPQQSNSKMIS